MKTIQNKTHKPLRIPLDGGHVLHLGPNKTGRVSDHAAERPAIRRLVESGEIAILDDGGDTGDAGAETAGGPEVPAAAPQRKVVIPTGGRTAGGRRER